MSCFLDWEKDPIRPYDEGEPRVEKIVGSASEHVVTLGAEEFEVAETMVF